MAYAPTYTSDDIAPVVIDTGVKSAVQFQTYLTIFVLLVIVLVFVLLWRKIGKAAK